MARPRGGGSAEVVILLDVESEGVLDSCHSPDDHVPNPETLALSSMAGAMLAAANV
jgi:hypothetical protein